MTRFGLIRHGITAWNIEKRSQGHSHNPLHEEGINQAHLVADRLLGNTWDLIVSSDLLRAKQTAHIIADKLGMAVNSYDARLRELGRGKAEGTTEDERIARWGADWRQLDMGYETSEEGMLRGSECLEELAHAYPGKSILVVSHGAILKNTLIKLKLVPESHAEELLDNTSVTIVRHNVGSDRPWSCELYNCTSHLRQNASNCTRLQSAKLDSQ